MISVIVPFYNEEKILFENSARFLGLSQHAELIFVDGESTDRSIEVISNCGKTLHSKRGRALQMNLGATFAKGDILLFLHADTYISAETLRNIENKIKNNGFIGGCLTQRIDKPNFVYRFIESEGNMRARIAKVFFGDQGIFVRKDVFSKIGGFPEVPIMEDIIFSKKLRVLGNTVVLNDKIFVSARRWEKRGIIKTTLVYSLVNILFRLHFPLDKIKRLCESVR